MKRNSLRIVTALLISSFLLFGCKKAEEAATGVVGCGTASASIVNELPAYNAAALKWANDPTPANCQAVKTSLGKIIKKVKGCSELTTLYEEYLKNYTCN